MERLGLSQAAVSCYMCCGNIEKVVSYWIQTLQTSSTDESTPAVQSLVERTMVFLQAKDKQCPPPDQAAQYFSKYAEMLVSVGQLDEAMRYLVPSADPTEQELQHRIFCALPQTSQAQFQAPAWPYDPNCTLDAMNAATQQATQAAQVAAQQAEYQRQQEAAQAQYQAQQDAYQKQLADQQAAIQAQQQAAQTAVNTAFQQPVQPGANQWGAAAQPQQPTAQPMAPQAVQPGVNQWGAAPQPQPVQPAANQWGAAQPQPVAQPVAPQPVQPAANQWGAAQPQPVAPQTGQWGISQTTSSSAPPAQPQPVAQPVAQPLAQPPVTAQPAPWQPNNSAVVNPPTQQQAAPTQQAAAPAPVDPELLAAGGFVKMALQTLLQRCQASSTNPGDKRKFDDISSKLEKLFSALNAGKVSQVVVTKLKAVCETSNTGNFADAGKMLAGMTKEHFGEINTWCPSVSRLMKLGASCR